MNAFLRSKAFGFIVVGVFALMSYFMLPVTVQSGDTGELVTNAYFLRVAHPPGYPLWSLLYHVPVRYLNLSNPFWTASFFTLLISLITFFSVGLNIKRIEGWLILSVLMTSSVIWKYSLLPDVFSLHLLFLALVFIVFLRPHLLNKWWMILLVSLCVAHHHTIVFVFPMFAYALYESGLTKKKIIQCTSFGLISFSIYFLMLFFHPDDYGSWGNIHGFSDVISHFLRSDYGTFKLASTEEDGANWFSFFTSHLLKDGWSLLLIPLVLFFKYRDDWNQCKKKTIVSVICLIIYFLVFSLLARVSLDVDGEMVFERFLIQPFFVVGIISLYLVFKSKSSHTWMSVLLVLNVGINIYRNHNKLNFSKKTGIHDLVINSFQVIPKNGVFLTRGDSFSFASYYLQEVEGIRKDIKLLDSNWNTTWKFKKVQQKFPVLVKSQDNRRHIFEILNFEEYPIYSNSLLSTLPSYVRMSVEGLIFKYSSAKSEIKNVLNCDYKYQFHNKPQIEDFEIYETNAYFDMAYGMCDFMKGLELVGSNQFQESEMYFKKAVALSPFSAKFMERLCHVQKKLNSPEYQNCSEKLDQLLLETHEQYYLNKYKL